MGGVHERTRAGGGPNGHGNGTLSCRQWQIRGRRQLACNTPIPQAPASLDHANEQAPFRGFVKNARRADDPTENV